MYSYLLVFDCIVKVSAKKLKNTVHRLSRNKIILVKMLVYFKCRGHLGDYLVELQPCSKFMKCEPREKRKDGGVVH